MEEYKENVEISRIRRITGYLTGDVKGSWNSAKQAELHDRTKNIGRVGFQGDRDIVQVSSK